ncbi:MAG: biotin/lipoyl-containing protein [Opitutales bacterium]
MKRLRINVEGKSYDVEVELLDEGTAEGAAAPVAPARSKRRTGPSQPPPPPAQKPAPSAGVAEDGAVGSPLAAVVVSVDVAEGDKVEEGQKLVTLEAMKMNTIVSAPAAGTVASILVKPGDGVEEGQPLIKVT